VSATRPALFGRGKSKRSVVGRGDDAGNDATEFECVRFCFFVAC
jgi:hypothetical protein